MTDEQLKLADELVKAIHITISTRDGTSIIRTNLMPNHRTMIDAALRAATRPAPTEAVFGSVSDYLAEALKLKITDGDGREVDEDSLHELRKAVRRAIGALSVGEAVSATDPLTDLVTRFSAALLDKLRVAEERYRWNNGWLEDGWKESCLRQFNEHIAKGDPRDVAAYCAFMWHHNWPTAAVPSEAIGREWHDISTAPKDGTRLLLCYATSAMHAGDLPVVSGHWSRLSDCWFSTITDDKVNPTHWMPLPAGPSVTRPHLCTPDEGK